MHVLLDEARDHQLVGEGGLDRRPGARRGLDLGLRANRDNRPSRTATAWARGLAESMVINSRAT